MTLTPLQRLDAMRATAPNTADAERLLSHLCVFREAFSRAGIAAIAPEDMSVEQRGAAFATLCQWRVVHKISQRRYRIDEMIRQQFPPTQELCERHFTYVLNNLFSQDQTQVFLYWEDIAAALLWGLEHRQDQLDDIAKPHGEWFVKLTWPRYLQAIHSTAQELKITAQKVFSAQESHLLAWYEAAAQKYIEAESSSQQETKWLYYGGAAMIRKDLPRARARYEKAMAQTLHIPARVGVTMPHLIEVLLKQRDIPAVYHYADLMHQIVRRISPYMRHLAMLMCSIPDYEAASRYFADAYDPNTTSDLMIYFNGDILKQWARVEYRMHHFQEALRLYGLAAKEFMTAIETNQHSFADNPQDEPSSFRSSYWQELNKLNAERQRIESLIAQRSKPRGS